MYLQPRMFYFIRTSANFFASNGNKSHWRNSLKQSSKFGFFLYFCTCHPRFSYRVLPSLTQISTLFRSCVSTFETGIQILDNLHGMSYTRLVQYIILHVAKVVLAEFLKMTFLHIRFCHNFTLGTPRYFPKISSKNNSHRKVLKVSRVPKFGMEKSTFTHGI